jgi:AcrR family transcriptional regulator
MAAQAPEKNTKKLGRTGKKTYLKIVQCAYEILSTESYEQLSMQGIAKRLGIRLSNVQYYFSTRADLITALLEHNNQLYFEQWQKVFKSLDDNPEQHFLAFVKFNLMDTKRETTRHFFIQLWPLLSTADDYSGRLLKEMYEPQMLKMTELISGLSTELSGSEARIRAELIASMLEGFMVTTPAATGSQRKDRLRDELTIATALHIASATA